ncbi:MAG: hypothetical protein HY815_13740 [Candidatus Riflebacteria bacterium]|nr:hypothetical protein [Candidatus Riflebacteria bacterium]
MHTAMLFGAVLVGLGFIKRVIGFPSPFDAGPAGYTLWIGLALYLSGAMALAGCWWGPEAIRQREVRFVHSMASFQDALRWLEDGAPGASAPVVLQCARCGVVFPWFARRLVSFPDEWASYSPGLRVELALIGALHSFEFRIEEPVTCPRCLTIDDYVYAEHPFDTLPRALPIHGHEHPSSSVVEAEVVASDDGSPQTPIRQWALLKEELVRNPRDARTIARVGRLYLWLRLATPARKQLEKALDIDPHCVPARLFFAQLLRNRGDLREAGILLMDTAAEVFSSDDRERELRDDPEAQSVLHEFLHDGPPAPEPQDTRPPRRSRRRHRD